MKGNYSPEFFDVRMTRRELDTLLLILKGAYNELELRDEEEEIYLELQAIRDKRDG